MITYLRRIFISFSLLSCCMVPSAQADAKKEFKVCWSHYTGWEPWAYAEHAGILKKWADKHKITIKLDLINDYIESINLYTAGTYDACTMTNMDALTIPAVGGVDSTALIIGDFSNGNDGVVSKEAKTIEELKGKSIKLVELSVSHYLLTRALEQAKLKEKDVTLVNTSDADIGGIFIADKKATAVTWNPILMNLRNTQKVSLLFDSSKIPGEIIDMMVVKTAAPESLKKALVGAWYETMSHLLPTSPHAEKAIAFMAKTAGASIGEFKAQLKTTEMFYTPQKAISFVESPELEKTMKYVRDFSFSHGLYGDGAQNSDFVGIQFANNSVMGDKGNVKLRFASTLIKEYAATLMKNAEVAQPFSLEEHKIKKLEELKTRVPVKLP